MRMEADLVTFFNFPVEIDFRSGRGIEVEVGIVSISKWSDVEGSLDDGLGGGGDAAAGDEEEEREEREKKKKRRKKENKRKVKKRRKEKGGTRRGSSICKGIV